MGKLFHVYVAGKIIAGLLSYAVHHSILLAMLHGLFGWFYVIWFYTAK